MVIPEKKIKKIAKFWNSFVFRYRIIQKEINWTDEVKTNYFGDILNYFLDTFELLDINAKLANTDSAIIYLTGILQIIYAQQDLIDELLYIFKLPGSKLCDKNPNREIRNELIGHPIRRNKKGNSLISSILWGRDTTSQRIHYVRYSRTNHFRPEEAKYEMSDIIQKHHDYLVKYFDLILGKAYKILRKYSKKLKELQLAIDNNVEFSKIVNLVSQRFKSLMTINSLYETSTILKCYGKKDKHPRYQYVIDLYNNSLLEGLNEVQSDIKQLMEDDKSALPEGNALIIPDFKIIIANADNKFPKVEEINYDYGYEISKLYDRHPIFGVSYFKKQFVNDQPIMEELTNMENNFYDDFEYLSSLEYMESLIKLKVKKSKKLEKVRNKKSND